MPETSKYETANCPWHETANYLLVFDKLLGVEMSKFIVEITTDNVAYEDSYYDEIIANLKGVISHIDCSELSGIIRDTNGNKVGNFYTTEGN